MKFNSRLPCRAKPQLLFVTTSYYFFFSALLNKHCSGLIVYPRLVESRDQSGQLILHVHDDLTLTLEKSSVLAENIQLVSTSSSDDFYTDILNGKELESDLYHDSAHKSSIILHQLPGGAVQVQGILAHNLRITPLALFSRSDSEESEHDVVEIQEKAALPSKESEPERGESFESQECDTKYFGNRTFHNTTDKFTVEVCMVISSSYNESFNTTKDLVEYLAAFLNAVQLRYTEMNDPEVFLQLNSISVVQGAVWFLLRQDMSRNSRDTSSGYFAPNLSRAAVEKYIDEAVEEYLKQRPQ
ncbi:uncharacterized protein LOC142768248 [Rhipicephalus microplus]|uniref:uncharacterized protein LOC142768248 n=1 Tax=Rhipicephalus microplus TaxID=6941 RepID=UPI003F6A7938